MFGWSTDLWSTNSLGSPQRPAFVARDFHFFFCVVCFFFKSSSTKESWPASVWASSSITRCVVLRVFLTRNSGKGFSSTRLGHKGKQKQWNSMSQKPKAYRNLFRIILLFSPKRPFWVSNIVVYLLFCLDVEWVGIPESQPLGTAEQLKSPVSKATNESWHRGWGFRFVAVSHSFRIWN